MIEKLLKALREIEQSAFALLHPESVFREVCEAAQSIAKFDFAALQLIREGEQIIETVFGTSTAAGLAGRSRHTLENDAILQDIQVDIALSDPPRAEVLAGYDARFDGWIFETFNHVKLVRASVPVFLVRDESGHVVKGERLESWIERWVTDVVVQEENEDRQRLAMSIQPPTEKGRDWIWKVIGTVEAGYTDRNKQITADQVIELTKCAARQAEQIHSVSLPAVLQSVVEHAADVLKADYASLHFDYVLNDGKYVYEATSGRVTQHFLNANPPRAKGLGRRAIKAGEVLFVPDSRRLHDKDELQTANPRLYELGIRAMAAMPLLTAMKEGVLYVGFRSVQEFNEHQLRSLELFANMAVDAISHAMKVSEARDQALLLESIHSVTESLVSTSKDKSLLERIAWDSLNILAADVVTIYEYHQRQNRFETPPVIAGRLVQETKMVTEIEPLDAPALLVKHGEPVFVPDSRQHHDVLRRERQRPDSKGASFVERERIRTSAGIPLKVGDEIVGLMFINYRRPHPFPQKVRKLILTLASAAAIAIRNRRLLDELQATDNQIVATIELQPLLRRIVEHAADITSARVAELYRMVPRSGTLELRARHPESFNVELIEQDLRGVAERVASTSKSELVVGLDTAPGASSIAAGASVFGVPLVDADQHVLGVLVVAQTKKDASERYEVLEHLAVQAVIAIQRTENQNKLVARESIATVATLATLLLHKVAGDLATINLAASDLLEACEGIADDGQEYIAEIKEVAAKSYNEIETVRTWQGGEKTALDLGRVLNTALEKVTIPSDIETVLKVRDGIPKIDADERQFIEVVINLLQNAVNAMAGDGGTLEICTNRRMLGNRDWVMLSIKDTGTGIREVDRTRVGERGYTTRDKGLGLGTWLAKTYIEMLGGEIEWKSEEDEGTEVTIVLPAHEPTFADDEASSE